MSGVKAKTLSKSGFIKSMIKEGADVSLKNVQKAWADAGHSSSILITSGDINHAKAYLKRKDKKKKETPVSTISRARLTHGGDNIPDGKTDLSWFELIESQLDALIQDALKIKENAEVVANLRMARRRCSFNIVKLSGY